MDVIQFLIGYIYVYFVFGEVFFNFVVGVSKFKNQFDKFVKMRGFKRIIVFCGWIVFIDLSLFWIF